MIALRVLLVDDEAGFVAALKERLELRGIGVVAAHDGASAVEAFRGGPFDAVVMDLQMPGMDGVETFKEMLAVDPDAQVIFLTGRGTMAKGIEAFEHGAIDFLSKPADFAKLLERIEDAASRRRVLSGASPGDGRDPGAGP